MAAAAGSARAAVAAVTADAHPTPADHEAWIDGGRLWERRPEDPDLLEVALGTADVPSRIVLARQSASSVDADPDDQLVGEAEALALEVAVLPGALLTFPLGDAGVVAVTGARGAALALVRAVLLELALTCAPDDLCLVVAVPPAEVPNWGWVKWLPHTAAATHGGHARAADRMVATSADELERHLEAVVAPRLRLLEEHTWATSEQAFARAVVVVDRFDPFTELGRAGTLTQTLARACEVGVTVIALCDTDAAPTETTALVTVEPGGGLLRRLGGPPRRRTVRARRRRRGPCRSASRRHLAPKRLVTDSIRAGTPAAAGWPTCSPPRRPAQRCTAVAGRPEGRHSCGLACAGTCSAPAGTACPHRGRVAAGARPQGVGGRRPRPARAHRRRRGLRQERAAARPGQRRSPPPTGRTTSSWPSPTSRAASRSAYCSGSRTAAA